MKIKTREVAGFSSAMYGMRLPMNSHHLSDSYTDNGKYIIGENDLKLAQKLIKAGNEHCKFLRQIQVWCDIDEPRYWWSEFDTYKIGTSANSSSTMHKFLNKKASISKDMFVYCPEDEDIVDILIQRYNQIREEWLTVENNQQYKDYLLLRCKRILLEGFLQLRTVNLNYSVIRHIVLQRKNHRLKGEWQDLFCKWATTLPYSKELIFCGIEDEYERLK